MGRSSRRQSYSCGAAELQVFGWKVLHRRSAGNGLVYRETVTTNPPGADPKTGPPSVTPARHFFRWVVVLLLRLRVWFTERGPGELWESNYFWAAIVGLCGAFSSVAFRATLYQMRELFLLHNNEPLDGAATKLFLVGLGIADAGGGRPHRRLDFTFRAKMVERRKGSRLHGGGRLSATGVICVRATIVKKSFLFLVTISAGGSDRGARSTVQSGLPCSASLLGRAAKNFLPRGFAHPRILRRRGGGHCLRL